MKKGKIKIISILLLFSGLLLFGTLGYVELLHLDFLNAFYMTVITVSTVGYGEVKPFNTEAKLFSIMLIFMGVAIAGYTFSTFLNIFIEGKLMDIWRNKKVKKQIGELSGHYIICGAGNTGEVIINQFRRENIKFVIIDKSCAVCERWLDEGMLTVQGNSTSADVLKQAGVENAKGLVSVLDSDVDNIVTVLTARRMNENLFIISHAIEKDALANLKKVGADKAISIKEIGGRRMATLLTHPNITSFLDVVTNFDDEDLNLVEFTIEEKSSFANQTLMEAGIPSKTGLLIIAIKKMSGEFVFNPGPDSLLIVGDSIIVMGKTEKIEHLRQLM